MKHVPEFVSQFIRNNNFLGNTKLLIIGENYPNPDYSISYFYRSLLPNIQHQNLNQPPQFFTRLCDGLRLSTVNEDNELMNEYERLINFFVNGFLLLDAQPNGIAPRRRKVEFDNEFITHSILTLIDDIIEINPERILFLTMSNEIIIDILVNEERFNNYIPRIINNPLNNSKRVFNFPSPPADPNYFIEQMNALFDQEFLR